MIVNLDSTMSPMTYAAIRRAAKVIFVGSGLADSNNHLKNKVDAIRKFDEFHKTETVEKVNILYNRFVNRNCTALSLENVTVSGIIPVIKERTEARLLEAMVKQQVLAQIIDTPEE